LGVEDMNKPLEQALDRLACCEDPVTYLTTQDGTADLARREYSQLLRAAREHASPDIRQEALQIISLLGEAGHREVLTERFETDSDPHVRELAKALLFRALIAESVRASGKLDVSKYEAYQRDVRELAARLLFRRTT
jgi:hypothetical protein